MDNENFDGHDYENSRHKSYYQRRDYDKNILIDYDKFIELYDWEYPDSTISGSKIQEYIHNGFFPDYHLENGEKGF